MIGFTEQTSAHTVTVMGMVQGFGLGLVFVPLSTVAFITLPITCAPTAPPCSP